MCMCFVRKNEIDRYRRSDFSRELIENTKDRSMKGFGNKRSTYITNIYI